MSVATPIEVPLQSIELSPGSCLTLQDVTWEVFEAIQDAYDERPNIRLAYCDGVLEITSPLLVQERLNRILADIITTILDAQGRDWEDFGSSTLRRQQKSAGVEPDTGLYVANADRVRDCMRLDLETDPPPDLAIESDLTSRTVLEAYERLQVPELWISEGGGLRIYLLMDGIYGESSRSLIFPEPIFPGVAIVDLIPVLLQQAFEAGTSRMLRSLRERLRSGS